MKKIVIAAAALFLVISVISVIVVKHNEKVEYQAFLAQQKAEEEAAEARRQAELAKYNNYVENLENFKQAAYNGSTWAKWLLNMTYWVKYNCYWQKRDEDTDKYTIKNGYWLNSEYDALQNFYNDSEVIDAFNRMSNFQATLQTSLGNLSDYPSGYNFSDASDAAKNLYDAYSDMAALAKKPGVIIASSLADKIDDVNLAFSNCYTKLDNAIPAKKY